ncbi:helicase associated domain-containing protein [Clostridium sp. AN503]|uniref:helicase associated domain-containing protein n=1 Tax=Clostridium sp. AN503 TaxID=3160598 RepID=UPI003457BCF2
MLETYRDFTSRKWDRIFQEVCEHCGESGDLFVPASAKTRSGVNIAGWINTQREAYRNNELTQMQIQKLEKAGMLWAPFEKRWQDMYELAKAYREEYGDLMIPHDYKTNAGENLGMWLSKQREKYRASQQTSHRIYMLEQLGIVWNPLDNRRARYQLAALEKMGAQWDVRGDKWEAMFEVAENYYREYGNLWVSPAYISPKGEYLGSWISHQRRRTCGKDRGRKLTAEQKKRLDGIGMVWNPFEAKWMNKYLLAKAFYLANGHLNIPSNFVCGDGTKLGMWLSSQRQAARGNPNYRMTPERRQMLDDIEMDWTLKSIRPDARHR